MSTCNPESSRRLWCLPVFMALFLVTLNAGAQRCTGNPEVGCTNAGAACSSADVPKGHCKTVPNLPRGERECTCEGPPPPPPTATLNPKYIVAAVVYAPPGCASPAPNTPCSQPGLVDYTSGSSMGSKVTLADSFKDGVTITASFGDPITGGGEASFGWNRTTGESKSTNLTKSSSLEIKVPGNGDGINHDEDMIELLLNPTIKLTGNGPTNIYWQPENPGARYEVYVGELRNPATMRPTVAAQLARAGLTAKDFKTIRCLDPFAGPGSSGPGGIRPDFCETTASTGQPSAPLDLNRFWPTTWILPYEPPQHASDACPSITATLKNEYAGEKTASTQDEYSVSASLDTGVNAANVFDWSVKIQGSMTWTCGETDTNTQGSTQSASLTLVCPSVGYTGPTIFQVYVDLVYGTFVFVPYDPTTMSVVQNGVVLDHKGKPLRGAQVDFAYNGRTFHTFTTANGHYRFIGLKQLINPAAQKGTISVGSVKRQVALGANPLTVRLP